MSERSVFRPEDDKWMDRALELAREGLGTTRPNPIVGAVLVKGGRVIGEGFHKRAGLPHAEREAFDSIKNATKGGARGATMYVTLEPCCHVGRTPPCTDALIEAGVKRVVVAIKDANPLVDGRGIARLRKAGIRVDVGCRAEQGEAQNRPFLTWIGKGRPWVTLKVASTVDGFIADWTMRSKAEPAWVTGPEARAAGHVLRAEHDAILVGAGTVMADDPRLTVRLPAKAKIRGGAAPLRVVLDGRLRVSPSSQVFRSDAAEPTRTAKAAAKANVNPTSPSGAGQRTLVYASSAAPAARARLLEAAGAEVIRMPGRGHRVDLADLLQELAGRNIQSLLVEGGADVHAAFIAAGLVDAIAVFQAPLLLGGGVPIARGTGRGLAAALRLGPIHVERWGDDLCFRALVVR